MSDDDFARVVHAQQFALDPKLDPTGTSWLPLPFWIYGAIMRLVAPSLDVARATAFALGIASALLLYAAARMLLPTPRDALLGTLIACVFPWSARLGVATVPELPTAALAIFALATLTTPTSPAHPRTRLLGAVALAAACLCRYEPWPLAAAFAIYCIRDRRHLAAAIALVTPAAWIAHNAIAHGDPFHFLARVSAYRRAIGGEADALVVGYPLALIREEPEIAALSAIAFLAAREHLPQTLRRVAIPLAAMLLLLTVAALPGGAPTHHAGRALLPIWLAAALYLGAATRRALATPRLRRPFAAAVLVIVPLGAFILRPWYARLDHFIRRDAEVAIGAAATRLTSPPILVEATDYGFFAMQAGSQNPDAFVLDRSIDPRTAAQPSSFTSPDTIRARARAVGARAVIARLTPITASLGAPIATHPPYALWSLQ